MSVVPHATCGGTYQGSIQVAETFGLASTPPATLPVTLTVTDAAVPQVAASPSSLTFTAPSSNAPTYSQNIYVTSPTPAAFSVSLPPNTWVKVSPMSGTTPATLSVTWDPAVTSQIYYQQSPTATPIQISGPANTVTVAATFVVSGVQTFQTYLGESGTGPNGLIFSAQTGSAPQTQTINVNPAGAISATTDQPWMSLAVPTTGVGAGQTVQVTAEPAGLAAGVYSGTVSVSEPGIASKAVPVTLGVWSAAPPLTISRNSFTFIQTLAAKSRHIRRRTSDWAACRFRSRS